MFELTERALVAASVESVWNEFTDAALLAQWIWPPRFETEAVVEPRELGRWHLRSTAADLAVEGRVLDIDPPRRLRLEWRWAGEDHTTDAELSFEQGGGCHDPRHGAAQRVPLRRGA